MRLNCEILGLQLLPGTFFILPALSPDVLLSIFRAVVQKCKVVVAERMQESPWRLRPNSSDMGAEALAKTLRRNGKKEHNTAHLGCCFLLIGLIHQRIYKACYLNAIFFYQNDNTIHKYSCTSSTDQPSSRVQRSTWRVSETAEFHIIAIIPSVIDRNKPCNIHL